MQKSIALPALLLATTLFTHSAMAKSPSWDSISVNYMSMNVEMEEVDDIEPTGFGFAGSKLLNENIFILGSYFTVSDDVEIYGYDIEIDLSQFNVGIGYKHGISETTDIYVSLAYVGVEIEASLEGESESVDDNGTEITVGLRSMLTEQFEAFASMTSTTVDDESETTFGVGGSYFFNEQVSAGVGYSIADDVDTLALSLNYHF